MRNEMRQIQRALLIALAVLLAAGSLGLPALSADRNKIGAYKIAKREQVPEGFLQHFPETIQKVGKSPFLQMKSVYRNARYGFAFDANGFQVDDSPEDIRTSFHTGYTHVDIYYNDLSGSSANGNSYIAYSNKHMKDNDYVSMERDESFAYRNQKVRVLEWKRKPLKHAKENDMDFVHYAILDIEKNPSEVYSIHINSVSDIDPMDYVKRFKLIPADANAPLKRAGAERLGNPNWSEETERFFEEDFQGLEKTELGIFEPTTAYYFEKLHKLEEEHELKFKYLLEYYSFSDTLYQHHFDDLYKNGRILEFTFQTSFGNELLSQMTYEVLDGNFDEKIDALASTLKNIKGPVFFRLNNEMNGDWCSYNALHFHRDTRLYTKMWEHFYRKIHEAGAKNVIFVFNPNEKSFPNFKWNHYMNYFPGRDFVDVIGVTGYNTGNYYHGETWRDFKHIYDEFMPDYRARFQGYDFFITEFGSSTVGGDRISWLDDMFEKLGEYGFKVAIYWNGTDWDAGGNPARPYKITDDYEAMRHFRRYQRED